MKNPAAEFTAFDGGTLDRLAGYDAQAYFQAHPGVTDQIRMLQAGQSHAAKHHLIAQEAGVYALMFSTTLAGLASKE